MAGIIDAVALLRKREVRDSGLLPVVAIHGGSPAIHDYMAKLTGTSVTRVNRDYQRKPCTTHCVEPHEHLSSVSLRWSVTGAKATILLYNTLPYLRLRKFDAQDLVDLGVTQHWKSQTIEEMQALGYKIPVMREQPRARASA
jgi:hypothetical protein